MDRPSFQRAIAPPRMRRATYARDPRCGAAPALDAPAPQSAITRDTRTCR
ncbi:hypothetical protein [Lysobacter gummosus]